MYVRFVVSHVNHPDRPGGVQPTVVGRPLSDTGAAERAQYIGLDTIGVGPEFIVFPAKKLKWKGSCA